MIDGSGMVGNFYDSTSLTQLDKYRVYETLEWQMERGKQDRFIETTIEGGLVFNSTEKYIKQVRDIIW